MKNFFRWASAFIGLAIIAVAIIYFVWMRDARLFDAPRLDIPLLGDIPLLDTLLPTDAPSEPSVGATTREGTTREGATIDDSNVAGSILPAPDSPATASSDAATLAPETPPARQAVVIVPPTATPEPDSPALETSSNITDEITNDSLAEREERIVSHANAPSDIDVTGTVETEIVETEIVGTGTGDAPASQLQDNDTQGIPNNSNVSSSNVSSSNVSSSNVSSSNVRGETGPGERIDNAAWLSPADVQIPDALAFGISTPDVRAQIVVPPVITAIAPDNILPTPTPEAPPTPAAPIQLYSAPAADSALPDATAPRSALEIVARDTTGNWYLLLDGLWIQANSIQNPPAQLPLVVPTVTPTPTNTGEPTPTEEPEPATPEPPTPTPTPTPLDFPVCDCTPNTYACVTHDFPVRAEAQACFEYCFRETGRDVHNLDSDGNGQACENLPE